MLRLATFTVDVTPPVGHALCAGMTKPSTRVRDPLHARGVILDDGRQRLVLCAVEYCAINARAHRHVKQALARGAGTTPDRVALHCVHQHDAPYIFAEIDDILRPHGIPQLNQRWWASVVKLLELAASTARFTPVTQVGTGEARVAGCASNRRLLRRGKVYATRWAKCTEPALQAEPVGLIDPLLRTVTLWNRQRLLASLSYYASHPQSADGRGITSADAPGEALRLVRQRFPDSQHIYFTGCAGNITFGKYATPDLEKNIHQFGQRLAAGITDAIENSRVKRVAPGPLGWRVLKTALPVQPRYRAKVEKRLLADPNQRLAQRVLCARSLYILANRQSTGRIIAQALRLGPAWILHLPAEVFVEYQLFAQSLRPEEFVAVAAYGDRQMSYLPTAAAFKEGGYEIWPYACHTTPAVEPALKAVIARLLAPTRKAV